MHIMAVKSHLLLWPDFRGKKEELSDTQKVNK